MKYKESLHGSHYCVTNMVNKQKINDVTNEQIIIDYNFSNITNEEIDIINKLK